MKHQFYTKYTLPERVLREFDGKDNVDRLSYVDTTLAIERFMEAGKILEMNYANNGLYHSIDDIEKETSSFMTPVYKDDPLVAKAKFEAFEKELNSVVSDSSSGTKPSEVKEDLQNTAESTSVEKSSNGDLTN